jgi:predicted esterase YcpF (UPF0227 family)
MPIRVLYLHGFASSPRGTKVQALRTILEPEGFEFHVPNLNAPSFETLDYQAMVRVAADTARAVSPAVIVGSSLGALIALEVPRRGIEAALVLIAPALGVADGWKTKIPDGDPIPVYNYAEEEERYIHRLFFDQMENVAVDREPPPSPVTVIMGRLDESVPFDRVAAVWKNWERSGRLVEGSRMIEIPQGDHSLTSHIDLIAREIRLAAEKREVRR